jgi:DHA2 family multidrug resistance protein
VFQATLTARGYGPVRASQGAYALLEQEVMRQASMLSYNDAWILLLISMAVVAPAILLLRRPKPGAAQVDAH